MSSLYPKTSSYVPSCDEEGLYRALQCNDNKCWCVTKQVPPINVNGFAPVRVRVVVRVCEYCDDLGYHRALKIIGNDNKCQCFTDRNWLVHHPCEMAQKMYFFNIQWRHRWTVGFRFIMANPEFSTTRTCTYTPIKWFNGWVNNFGFFERSKRCFTCVCVCVCVCVCGLLFNFIPHRASGSDLPLITVPR